MMMSANHHVLFRSVSWRFTGQGGRKGAGEFMNGAADPVVSN